MTGNVVAVTARLAALALLALITHVNTTPVDNGVEGEPIIECGPDAITVNFNTKNPFEGHVYVKGFYDQPSCRNDNTGGKTAGITLPFGTCNVARSRSLNPLGVLVHAVVVITFHPLFVTKVDRAYRLQCFYMQADKTVSTQLEVSEITTAFATQIVPMPICRYEILDGSPTGQPVSFGTIGQPVYHKWTCDTETVETFCAVVHSCTVNDGAGDKVQLLDSKGCALDKYLLNNLEYSSDLMAGQEAHVYKYADRSQLFFECQITITIKEPNGQCERPACSEPIGFGSSKSQSIPRLLKRESGFENSDNTMDVQAELSALEISDQESNALPMDLSHRARIGAQSPIILAHAIDGLCFSSFGFSLMVTLGAAFMAAVLVAILFFFRSNSTKS